MDKNGKLIYHWSNIMDDYHTLMLKMEPNDLGQLIQELLKANSREQLKNNTVSNKAVSYILTMLSEDEYIGHTLKEEDNYY